MGLGVHSRKSRSGWAIMFAGSPVVYQSKLQTLTSQSTAEAECISACEATKSIIHVKLLLKELGFVGQYSEPVVVHEDNSSVVAFSENLKSRKTTRHFEMRVHYLQEMVQDNEVTFRQTKTVDQLADLMTKALARDQHRSLTEQLLGYRKHTALEKECSAGQQGGGETSLTSGNTSGSIEPALESPDGEASPSIAALVMAAIQQNDSRMPTAAIVLQKASELENQHQYSRQRSMCSYGFSNLHYEYVI